MISPRSKKRVYETVEIKPVMAMIIEASKYIVVPLRMPNSASNAIMFTTIVSSARIRSPTVGELITRNMLSSNPSPKQPKAKKSVYSIIRKSP